MKIALLGYGIEGESAYRYLKTIHPSAEFVVYDQASQPKNDLPDAVSFVGEVKGFHDIDADLVVRTPAIRPDAITTRGKVTSVTNLFFEACSAPIIGVTGSKGKGTTSSLIMSILRAAGHTVHLIGNIGEPALNALVEMKSDDIVVYELSSFQLWDLEKSPHVAVVLMIEADHLDVHTGMAEYIAAKAQITQQQTAEDIIVYNTQNNFAQQIAEQSKANKIPYPTAQFTHIKDDFFYYGDTKLCPVTAVKLPGEHNLQNACAAIAAAWPWAQDGEVIARGLSDFTGLPHRLKFVREVSGVKYYDDSIATTPGSAIAAVNAFSQPKVIILGGSSKGADFTELAEVMAKSTIRQVLLIGQEATKIAAALDAVEMHDYMLLPEAKMNEIVAQAQKSAEPGDIAILSPACASFGRFKNYKDRGEQFIAAVEKLQ